MEIFIPHILFIVILLCFSAFFSGSEAALFSLSRAQTRRLEQSSAAGRLVSHMLAQPRELLITILLGNLLVNVLATSVATSLSIRAFGEKGVGYSFLLMSAVVIAFGDIFPKVIALNKAETVSKAVIFPLRFFHTVFMPLWFLLARMADGALSIMRRRLGHHKKVLSSDELLTAVNIGLKEGDLEEFDHEVLSNILSFRETIVREIMTPSIDVFSLPATLSKEDLVDAVRKNTFSRIPLYGDTTDDIRGILHVKDLMRILRAPAGSDIAPFLRPPFYIPESARISELLKHLLERKTHFAVVIDEYGSFVGIVTLEDILEELIGEIHDATDPMVTDYKVTAGGRIIVAGTMEIDKFNHMFGTTLPDEEFDTIAGYVIGRTGYIPFEGETITIENLRFHIISAQPNRVRKLRVEML